MASLGVAVLDVVMDKREVVPQLHRGGARQREPMVAGDAGVGEEAQQRSDPLAARRPGAIEREVIADHLVQPAGRRIVVADQADDLGLGVGEQGGEIDVLRGSRHAPILHETCSSQVACWPSAAATPASGVPAGGQVRGTLRARSALGAPFGAGTRDVAAPAPESGYAAGADLDHSVHGLFFA